LHVTNLCIWSLNNKNKKFHHSESKLGLHVNFDGLDIIAFIMMKFEFYLDEFKV
jgi:chromosome condensin MukBEF MukE localization factor